MKHLLFLFGLSFAFLAACSSASGDKQANVYMASQDSVASGAPQRMQVSRAQESFVYKGKEYQSVVIRQPDDNLPLVKDEQGEKFVDNRITLRLTCGGKTVVDKEFTKECFASKVDTDFLRHAILEGVVFDEVTPQGMVYAASICYPQTDLYIPLRITVDADGKIALAKEELLYENPDSGR